MGLPRAQQRRLLELARSADASTARRERALAELLADFERPAKAAMSRVFSSVGAGNEHVDEAWARAVYKFYEKGMAAYEGRSRSGEGAGAAPRSYFVRLAINAAVDVCRQLARSDRKGSEGSEEAAPPDPSALGAGQSPHTPVEALEARDAAAWRLRELSALAACVDTLGESYREPVRMYYLQELGSCERCAVELGIAKNAFMQRLSRARRQLARCIETRLGASPEETR